MNHFKTDKREYTILDAPGHKDFVSNMITGAAQADIGILVVSSAGGEFDSGFSGGGQTKEHARLARSLGINKIIIAVNKLDTQDWEQQRYDDIRDEVKEFLTKKV